MAHPDIPAEQAYLDHAYECLDRMREALPGYSRPMIRAEQYLELVEQHTYRGDRVRPAHA